MNDYEARMNKLKKRDTPPLTPGEVVAGILEEQGISQTKAADDLNVSRTTLNELINGRRSLTPDMAYRLGRYFGNGMGVWLRMQQTVDLWNALQMDQSKYESIGQLRHAA
jgi:addiction module HigA family antidote